MQYVAFSLLLLCWIVPTHFPPWATFHVEAPAVAAGLLGLIICFRWSGHAVRVPAAVGFMGLFIAIAMLQWSLGLIPHGGDVVLIAIYVILLASAWLWGYQWAHLERTNRLLDALCLFMLIVGVLVAFQALVQWFHLEGAFWGWVLEGSSDNRPRANIGQANHVATVLSMASVATFSLRYRRRIGRMGLWLALLLFGAGIVLTRSRTALVSVTALTVFCLIFFPHAKCKNIKSSELVVWLLLIFGMTWLLPYFSNAVNGDIALPVNLTAIPSQFTTPGARTLVWQQITEAILQRPWWGWGFLQVPAAQQAGALMFPGNLQLTYSHNMLLDALVMLGIPITLILVCVILRWIWIRASLILESVTASTATFILIPLIIHAQLEFPHAYAYFLILAGLLFGVIDGAVRAPVTRAFFISKKMLAVFAMGWSVLLGVVVFEYSLAEEDFRVNRFENRNIGSTPEKYNPPKLFLLNQLGDMLRGMRLRAVPGMSQEDLDVLVRVSQRYSWAQMQFRTALALGLNGRPDDATRQLQIIKVLYSKDIYDEAIESLNQLAREKYPELKNIAIP